jgi:hypothetical protein
MASGTMREIRRGGGATRRLRPAALTLLLAIAACNPVDTWRRMTGASKYDPNPATTPNGGNLAAGTALPYPNLATVPPPPTSELTETQLKELTQSLLADRKNARYTSQQLRSGLGQPAPPPSPPTIAAAAPAQVALAAVRAAPAPPQPAPPPSPPTIATAAPAQVAVPPAPAPPQPAPGAKVAARIVAGSNPVNRESAGVPSGMTSGLRKPGQPPELGPMESSLVSPRIPETPQPEQPQPAPPRARIVAIPAAIANGTAHLPPPPPAVPLPAKIPAFEPPPPPPVLVPPPPQTAIAAPSRKQQAPPVPAATPVAEIAFAGGSARLSDSDRVALEKVAARYRQSPGAVRVVGYVPAGNGDPLASFRRALDQAQAVAAALAKAGVPADKIEVEASPASAAGGGNRAEVLLLH